MEDSMYHSSYSKPHRRQMPKLSEPRRLAGQSYYWIWAIKDSRLVVVGCKASEQEAYEFGYGKLGDIDFRVEQLPTRDMNTAVRMIKGKVLDKSSSLDMAIKRARRQV
jgi:hypothetical protein